MTSTVVRGLVVLTVAGGLVALAQQRTPPPAVPITRVMAATTTFLNTLDERQRAKVSRPLNSTTRTVWSNLPTGSVMQVGATERNGLKFGDMTDAQREAAMAGVATVLSRSGYQKVVEIINGDQRLKETLTAHSSPAIKLMNTSKRPDSMSTATPIRSCSIEPSRPRRRRWWLVRAPSRSTPSSTFLSPAAAATSAT